MGRWSNRPHLIQCTTVKNFLVPAFLLIGYRFIGDLFGRQPSFNIAKSKGKDVFHKKFLPSSHPGSFFISSGARSRRSASCEPKLTPSLARGGGGGGEFHGCAPILVPMGFTELAFAN